MKTKTGICAKYLIKMEQVQIDDGGPLLLVK
jgi:hypothetical protein